MDRWVLPMFTVLRFKKRDRENQLNWPMNLGLTFALTLYPFVHSVFILQFQISYAALSSSRFFALFLFSLANPG